MTSADRSLPEEITAYGAALQAQIPMTPEMILDYRRRLDESQKAAATTAIRSVSKCQYRHRENLTPDRAIA